MDKITPHMYLENIFAIPHDELKENGIRGMIFDLDNTITEWHSSLISREAKQFLADLQAAEVKFCLLSNNRGKRVREMAEALGMDYVTNARKPFKKGYLDACEIMGLKPAEAAMVGDQLFTDIYGGRKAGVYTILVKPIGKREMWGTKNISRRLERLVWRRVMGNIQAGLNRVEIRQDKK